MQYNLGLSLVRFLLLSVTSWILFTLFSVDLSLALLVFKEIALELT